jgi:glycosyltransferase involved in cell wall biosynthesis
MSDAVHTTQNARNEPAPAAPPAPAGESASASDAAPLRVIVQQPSLAHYRLPVYQELASRPGIDLRLLYGEEPAIPNVEPAGITASLIKHRTVPGFRWMPAHFKATRRGAADVAVMTGNVRHLSLLPALRRARKAGVGAVLWTHGYSKHSRGILNAVRRKSLDLGDAILLYNHTARRQLIEAGLPEEKLFVALNSLDQTHIRAARDRIVAEPGRLAELQRDRDIEPSQTVLYVSRITPANRLDLLVEAAAILRERFPRFNAVIIGKGEQREELEALAEQRGVAGRVRFLGAIYDEDVLATWFCSSAIFCYPANIGLSLLHAFGYGLPVVTSDRVSAQNPEIEALEHDRNGLLYQDGSAESLAEAIASLLDDPGKRQRLAAEAQRTVDTRFTIANMVDGIVAACRYASDRAAERKR